MIPFELIEQKNLKLNIKIYLISQLGHVNTLAHQGRGTQTSLSFRADWQEVRPLPIPERERERQASPRYNVDTICKCGV